MPGSIFLRVALVVALLALPGLSRAETKADVVYGQGARSFSLATGSPGELGLLKVLGETFCADNDCKLVWRKAGSGQSLKLLKEKAMDMIMVHAPAAEKAALSDGWATQRTLLGSNEFFIVGPASDPAGIAGAKDAADAYRRIAQAKAKFFSRGDKSGTHMKEMSIWSKAGIEPSGDWYVVTKDFMTATLKRAHGEQGYFMTDSGTWVQEKKLLPNLKILFKGDKYLINTYHALRQPDGADLAAKFITFVASPAGQKIIGTYGEQEYGEGLYNDAAYAKQYDD